MRHTSYHAVPKPSAQLALEVRHLPKLAHEHETPNTQPGYGFVQKIRQPAVQFMNPGADLCGIAFLGREAIEHAAGAHAPNGDGMFDAAS